jgi:hypothetical protein
MAAGRPTAKTAPDYGPASLDSNWVISQSGHEFDRIWLLSLVLVVIRGSKTKCLADLQRALLILLLTWCPACFSPARVP